ncbi:MAG: hypothetical protein ACLP07_15035 [Terracidiphilus sp.]
MSVDKYERKYHLTAEGWHLGTFYFYGKPMKKIPPPPNRVLTIVKEVVQSHAFSPEEISWREDWRSKEAGTKTINRLLKKFGDRATHVE